MSSRVFSLSNLYCGAIVGCTFTGAALGIANTVGFHPREYVSSHVSTSSLFESGVFGAFCGLAFGVTAHISLPIALVCVATKAMLYVSTRGEKQ